MLRPEGISKIIVNTRQNDVEEEIDFPLYFFWLMVK